MVAIAKLRARVPSNGSLTHEREGFLSEELRLRLNRLSDRNLVLFHLKELKDVDDSGVVVEKRGYGYETFYPWSASVGRALMRLGVLKRRGMRGKTWVDWFRIAEILGPWDPTVDKIGVFW